MITDDTSASSADTTTEVQTQPVEATPQAEATPELDANTQNAADTSTADDTSVTEAEQPKSLLDVVKDVVEPTEEPVEDKESLNLEKAEDGKATEAKVEEDKPVDDGKSEPTEADDAKLPFHKHPRFQQVIQERSAFKKEIETLKPEAQEWRSIRTFMETNSLTNDEVAKGFEIMAAMKNDPIRGRDMLAEYWNNLQAFAGAVLPQDLKQRVDDGEVTDDVASELARRRNEAEFLRQRQEVEAQRQQEQAQMQQYAATQQIMRSAVVDWESGIKTRDADYSVKQPFLLDKVRAAMAVSQPRTSQEAIALVERAYSEVNDSLKRFTPSRPAATTVRSETSSANVAPQPKNLRDVIKLAAAGQL